MTEVRTRFCPSPTGVPHVGLVRTYLFSWAYARHHGGQFVFRIEDTDAARDSEESYHQLVDALSWMGLDWDEGVEKGGPHGPYRQSERTEIYADVMKRLLDGGYVYEAFSTPDEVEARHRAAGRDPKLGYDNFDRTLTQEQKDTYRAEGRKPVLRLRMPDTPITFTDGVRGEITYEPGNIPDFVIARADGSPLYTLTNPVDDAMMRITHIIRGEDLLSSTPRQIALYRALVDLGVAERVPQFAHAPLVVDESRKKMSKRDPRMDLLAYRDKGYLPEGIINYVGTLGWSIAADRDVFTLDEMVAAFDLADVNSSPARFDEKKLDAINAHHIRQLAPEDLAKRLIPVLQKLNLLPDEPTAEQLRVLAVATPLVQERTGTLVQGAEMLRFLYAGEDFALDEASATKTLKGDAGTVLDASIEVLSKLDDWSTEAIETALKTKLIDELEIKPRKAFAPVRVAATGKTVSPPLYESLELLGREVSLDRLRAARERVAES
ncbi:glutamate--tRNA ligase [Stackebrandtia nassauensis]|uniref:Glutamate--tRNA ligase n=1 Tax=Stackebrandtia nassauensis (strain DSM 44728 / CIP 108903 / NRRL B-16338 / NBRC 102104 / LLR-40K-21) TaxID=446470 RepID=D3PZJ2_STANL|nr:glutamate--tRNA ligase [Stackebrandtia nassauensis]ADD41666.1 glutamyl-tRNA synthetase [Stackebrandtia nassauensis DSM 44728]